MRTKFTAVTMLLLLVLLFTGLVAERTLAPSHNPPPPPTPPILLEKEADLVFKSVTFKPLGASTAAAQPTPIKVGDPLEFTAVVMNKGTGKADAFSVELKDSAGAVSQIVAEGLLPNAEKELKFTRKLNKELETFTFTLDPDNKVAESDENNNVFKLEVRAGAAGPSPTDTQELALIHVAGVQIFPNNAKLSSGKVRLFNATTNPFGHDPVRIINLATNQPVRFNLIDPMTKAVLVSGVDRFAINPGAVTAIELELAPGEYEISHKEHGHTITAKLIVR